MPKFLDRVNCPHGDNFLERVEGIQGRYCSLCYYHDSIKEPAEVLFKGMNDGQIKALKALLRAVAHAPPRARKMFFANLGIS